MDQIRELQNKAAERRADIVTMIYESGGGHAGGSLSSADILTALFYRVIRVNPKDPSWPGRDRFVLSKGHSVEGYYAILADLGFFSREELKTFSKFKSHFLGHPSMDVPGVDMSTGSLGHGLPVAVGMALAGKMDRREYRVFVLMGDGEQAEGSVWEAAMAAANYKLDNLVAVIDRNRLQISGCTEDVMRLESLSDKWRAFGWEVRETDGHDMHSLLEVFGKPPEPAMPLLIIANTIKGRGVSFMENDPKWHHGKINDEQFRQAINELRGELGG